MAAKETKKNLHEGHRQRMLTKIWNYGTDVLEPHELLETLLFYAQPRCNTNDRAHRLLDYFGSLPDVFHAPIHQLCEVDGIGQRGAILIKLVFALFLCYQKSMEQPSRNSSCLNCVERVFSYFKPRFTGETEEVLLAAFLDNGNHVTHCEECGRGVVNTVKVSSTQILQHAMTYNAASIILAHNHPNGQATPSTQDIEATMQLARTLESFHITLLEHCIVAGQDACCIMQSPEYRAAGGKTINSNYFVGDTGSRRRNSKKTSF